MAIFLLYAKSTFCRAPALEQITFQRTQTEPRNAVILLGCLSCGIDWSSWVIQDHRNRFLLSGQR